MRKKIFTAFAVIALVLILFVPISRGTYKDGGTKEFAALTYKIVKWNRLTDDGIYSKTRVYILPDSLKSIGSLWEKEKSKSETAPSENEEQNESKSFNKAYGEEWIIKDSSTETEEAVSTVEVSITEIYSDCFFASPIIPMPYTIKINGTLDEKWCVGDKVSVEIKNIYYDNEKYREEADMVSIAESNFTPDPNVCYKPVIYLYPEKEMPVNVTLELDGEFTCTYPEYGSGWKVTAKPDGTLTDADGQAYNYLYWEGETAVEFDFSKGFCVKGENTADFLEYALSCLGLNRKEANEFIVYWLPLMKDNKYNIISFQTDTYTDAARLCITPTPDTLIRVFMAWTPSDKYTEIPAQELKSPVRRGFTAVEWGGTQAASID